MRGLTILVFLCIFPSSICQQQSRLLFLLNQVLNQNTPSQVSPLSIDEEIENAAGPEVFNNPIDAESGGILLQGDILMDVKEFNNMLDIPTASENGGRVRKKRKTAQDLTKKWNNNEVMILHNSRNGFSHEDNILFQSALNEWQQKTCLRFRSPSLMEAYRGKPFILIQNGRGCSSPLGMNPMRRAGSLRYQPLNLAKACRKRRIMMHEIGHALGLIHEQSRSDRDQYVRVIWENVAPHMRHNFQKFTTVVTNNRQTPYDYQSLMHYGPRAFSSNKRPTIQTYDESYQNSIGSFSEISANDAEAVNRMYNCGGSGLTFPSFFRLFGKKK